MKILKQSLLVVTLAPVMANASDKVWIEEFNGATIAGTSQGLTYESTPTGQGARFTRNSESRVQYSYSEGMPKSGTIEILLKVDSAYQYRDNQLSTNEKCALIFTTDVGGGDVTYPGSAWFRACSNGDVSLTIATTKYGKNPSQLLVAEATEFRFGQWHTISYSFGKGGQVITVNGKVVASNLQNTQELGAGGTHNSPIDVPTLGESQPGYWSNNQWDGGFEGVVDKFAVYNGSLLKIEIPPKNTSSRVTSGDEWLVNGNCLLTFPYNAVKHDKSAFIIVGGSLAELLQKHRTEIIKNPNSEIVKEMKWSGKCNSDGKADGYGKLIAKLFPFQRGWGPEFYYIYIEGIAKDGQFSGKVKTETGDTYTAQLGISRTEFYIEDGMFFWSERDVQEYKYPSLKTTRITEEAKKKAQEEREQSEAKIKHENMLQNFRKRLKEGDDTSDGVVIQVKGSLIKIQTNESQCTQRDYNGACRNYVNTPAEKWFKRSEVYPK